VSEIPVLVLASGSRYRRELLSRLGLPFEVIAPEVDEASRPGEPPARLAARLARSKALAVAARSPGSLVIGSDQVADRDGALLGKPGHHAAAVEQLLASAGRTVAFHTALCLVDARAADMSIAQASDITRVVFRPLDRAEIERYVDHEQPFDCAGSFKAEGLGISLFEQIASEDPSALVGLPLIALCHLLRNAGLALP
jgi:septum formation protein